MKTKFIQFFSLIAYMMLLNLAAHLIGIMFIEKYIKYERFFLFFDSLFLIGIYAIFQIFVFPIHKKYRIYIIPLLTLIFSLCFVYGDTDGYGGEFMHGLACSVSKIISVIFCFVYDITNNSTRFFIANLLLSAGYSLYLLAVFSSFKYIMKYLGKKYLLFAVNRNDKNK